MSNEFFDLFIYIYSLMFMKTNNLLNMYISILLIEKKKNN